MESGETHLALLPILGCFHTNSRQAYWDAAQLLGKLYHGLVAFRAARANLARNSGEKVLRGRLIEMLLGTQRLNDQQPIINYRPVSKNRSGSEGVK